jgi:hypothetical protein
MVNDNVPLIGDEAHREQAVPLCITPGAAIVLAHLLRMAASQSNTPAYIAMIKDWEDKLEKVAHSGE